MPRIFERVAAAGARAGGLPCEVQQRIPVCISGGQRGGHRLFLARLHVFLHEGAAARSCLPDPGAYPSLCVTIDRPRYDLQMLNHLHHRVSSVYLAHFTQAHQPCLANSCLQDLYTMHAIV